MKKMSELMADLGFRADAPDKVKEAFVQHLIHASTGQLIPTPTQKKEKQKRIEQALQLEFDFGSSSDSNPSDKKTG